MNEKQLKQIENQIKAIEQKIADLENDKIALYPEEYKEYLRQYARFYYDDNPLPLRGYYELSQELEKLNATFPKDGEKIDLWFQENGERMQYLERRLAA